MMTTEIPPPQSLGVAHSEWRKPQLHLLSFLEEDNHRWAFIQAPPGAGKSALAVGRARMSGARRTIILTRTLSLMEQYHQTYGVPTLKGRANFKCGVSGYHHLSADSAPCRDGAPCTLMGDSVRLPECEYYVQLEAAMRLPIVVTTYAWWMATHGEPRLPWGNPASRWDLVVCDEAHNLITELSEFGSATVEKEFLPLCPGDLAAVPAWARATAEGIPQPRADDLSLEAARVRRTMRNLEKLTHIRPHLHTYVKLSQTSGDMKISPVWPTGLAEQMFRNVGRVVAMSATMHPGGVLPKVLGIPGEEWIQTEVASTFPVSRRPFYFWPQGNMSKGKADFPRVGEAISQIISKSGAAKGLIHVASVYQAVQLYSALRPEARAVTLLHAGQRGADRISLLARFRHTNPPCWLISPSVHEGEDFPYDGCRAQVIAKVMWPDLGDPLVRLRSEDGPLGREWYKGEADNRVTQAYGRAMRHEDDVGITYATDGSLSQLLRGSTILHTYAREAIIRI